MSKVGSWVLGMQEDATWMTKEQFIKTHGLYQVDIWEKIQSGEDENWEPDYEPENTEEVFEA
jgi:hypothetical protein